MRPLRLLPFFTLVLLLGSCGSQFELYAPAEEIRIVYGILDATDTVQYIRVARAFQVEGDAYTYASSNDLSMQGLSVKVSGAGNVHEAVQVDHFPKELGDFTPYHSIYKFATDNSGLGREALVPGERYTLEIGSADAPDYIRAETDLPSKPVFRGDLLLVAGQGNTTCLPTADLNNAYDIEFLPGSGYAFELRAYLEYTPVGGTLDTAVFGPTEPFTESEGCPGTSSKLCYRMLPKRILRSFYLSTQGQMASADFSPVCVMQGVSLDSLERTLQFEVTAMDQALFDYMRNTEPGQVDAAAAKPVYSNLSGNIAAFGVFGSIHKVREPAQLNPCSLALLELNNTDLPLNCAWED